MTPSPVWGGIIDAEEEEEVVCVLPKRGVVWGRGVTNFIFGGLNAADAPVFFLFFFEIIEKEEDEEDEEGL